MLPPQTDWRSPMASSPRPLRVVTYLLLGLLLSLLVTPGSARAQQRIDTSDFKTRRVQKLFVRGMTQSYLEDHEEAVSYFEQALEASPGQPAILMALAEAEAARDNVTSALYYARQARDGAPEEPYYAQRLATLQEEAGRPQEAAATYQALLAKFPDHNDARLPLARLRTELDQPKKALTAYEAYVDRAKRPSTEVYAEMLSLYEQMNKVKQLEGTLQVLIDRRRNNRSYRKRLADLYVKQKRFEEALPIVEALVQEGPENPQLLSRLEKLYERTGNTERAEALWDRFTEKSADPDQLVARARSMLDGIEPPNGQLDTSNVRTARRLLQQALDQDSTHVGALDLLGTIDYRTGAYATAGQVLDRALDQNPRTPQRWQRSATAHLRAGHPQRAAAVAEEGLLLFPGRPDLLAPLGFARLRLNEPETARAHFQNALDNLDDRSLQARARAYAGLGLAHDRLGDGDQATDALGTALDLAPEEPTVLWAFAQHLAQRETDLDRALSLAQRATERAPADPQALGVLGWVHYKRGAYDKAKTAFQEAVDTDRAPARVYEQFGDLHRAIGNDRLARRYWKEALDRNDSSATLRKKLDARP